ncbi:hypothetical protein CJ469_04012 [Nocardia farcinica]|uniref:GAF domain-containing protein n=1 Tax=Nocardia farcinica TaxID=37329 RepID=UPI000BF5BC2F|nr:GAF domain-containing protein [Nocardia farcinica]PFX01199.1 hypothetical protein CJ469_04012 [Nocardia farcinica]PFX07603.1 hypothetical protein CJ468_03527 [Nocardia farcinica]
MWFVVDTAEPDKGIRHVPEDGPARTRSLTRAIRPNSLAAVAVSVVGRAIEAARPIGREVLVRGEDHRVLAIPVPGPDGAPLAVQLWAAAARVTPPEPPAVDVFVWDGPQWTVRSSGAGGPVLPPGHPLLHGAWFLSRIIECEGRDRLMSAALDPRPGVFWQGSMQVRTPDDRTTRVFGFFRPHGTSALRAVLLQIESARAPGLVPPTYHHDAAAALLDGATALIDLQSLQIIEWLTPPPAGIAWRHHPASRELDPAPDGREFSLATTHLVHPDDLARYLEALRDLSEHRRDEVRIRVRLLTVRRGWQLVELYCVRLPKGLPRFATCLIRIAR